MRQQLAQLLTKMEGNDKLEALLAQVMSNTEKAQDLAKQMGTEAPKPEDKP
jgi:predicted component of type VI protein secretion system